MRPKDSYPILTCTTESLRASQEAVVAAVKGKTVDLKDEGEWDDERCKIAIERASFYLPPFFLRPGSKDGWNSGDPTSSLKALHRLSKKMLGKVTPLDHHSKSFTQ